jgi:hypothetical protein
MKKTKGSTNVYADLDVADAGEMLVSRLALHCNPPSSPERSILLVESLLSSR